VVTDLLNRINNTMLPVESNPNLWFYCFIILLPACFHWKYCEICRWNILITRLWSQDYITFI